MWGLSSPVQFSSVQSLSHVQLFAAPWTAACQASLSTTNSWSLLKLTSIASVMQSHNLILCSPLFLPPSILPSIRVFLNESILCIRWPKYQSFSFNISPSNEHSRLICFRIDRLDLLAVQSSPTPQFKGINSSALSILYSPTLTSAHDYWKNHSLDQTDLTGCTLKSPEVGLPCGPVVKTLPSNAGIAGLTPGQGARIPHASLPKSQSIKETKLQQIKKLF